MRTTLDVDEDILSVAKSLASERGQSLGRVLSDLARRGLARPSEPLEFRNGIPMLPRKPGAQPVTSQHVRELLESES
jgi:hypothetical protein